MNTAKLVNVCMSITKIIKILTNKFFSNFSQRIYVRRTVIGLTSDSTSLGGKTFGIGVILEIFH